MNDRGSNPCNGWQPIPPPGGLLRSHVALEPVTIATTRRKVKHTSKWPTPLILTLVCSGVLAGLGTTLLATRRSGETKVLRASPATNQAAATSQPSVLATSDPMPAPAPVVAATPRVEAATPPAGQEAIRVSVVEDNVEPAQPKAAFMPVALETKAAPPVVALPPTPATVDDGPQRVTLPAAAEDARRAQQVWAQHLKQAIIATNKLDMKLALLPPGEMLMGSPRSEIGREENEGPQRNVTLSAPFYMGVHEVTVGQFARFVTATGYKTQALRQRDDDDDDNDRGVGRGRGRGRFGRPSNPSAQAAAVPDDAWYHTRYAPGPSFPVVHVSWDDAQEFCAWLSEIEGRRYRLPTEAEWEYACRAGRLDSTSWGEAPMEHARHGWFRENSGGRTRAAGELRASVWGLHDMHGNVAEWCGDWLGTYGATDEVDPTGPADGDERVLRGGAWDASRLGQRSAWRAGARPAAHSDRVGFRVVCEIDPTRIAPGAVP